MYSHMNADINKLSNWLVCLIIARPQIVIYQNDGPTPYVCMGNILKDHYENLHFDEDEVRFIRNMVFIWCMLDARRQHDMLKSFRDDPRALQRVVKEYSASLSMAYFKARHLYVWKRSYT